jgi:hypothetical protein
LSPERDTSTCKSKPFGHTSGSRHSMKITMVHRREGGITHIDIMISCGYINI